MPPALAQWYRRHKFLVWVVVGAWALYSLAGFVAVPMAAHHLLKTTASNTLNRQVSAGTIRANPYTFSIRLTALSITEGDGSPFVFVRRLRLNVDPLISLFKWGAVVKSIEVDEPQLRIVRTNDDGFNFSDLITPKEKAQPEAQPESARPLRFVLRRLKLNNGQIAFTDKAQGTTFDTQLSDVNISLNDWDTLPDAGAALYELSALSEAKESLQISGQFDLDPLDLQADIALAGLALSKYAPYYGDFLNAQITQGDLGLTTYAHWSDDQQSFSDIVLTLGQLTVTPKNDANALVTVPRLEVEGASVDLKNRQIGLGRITSRDGHVKAVLADTGALNLQDAFAPPTPAAADPSQPKQNRADDGNRWQLHLPVLALKNYQVDFHDQQTTPKAHIQIQAVGLRAENLSTQRDAQGKVTLDLKWSDQGELGLTGTLGLFPIQGLWEVTAAKMDIRPLQPYLNPHARLVVTTGDFNTKGQLRLAPKESSLDVQYTGQAAVNGFASVDAAAAGDFLKFKSLFLTGLEVGTTPFRLGIKEVALTDFFNRLIIDAEGKSNISAVFSSTETTADHGNKTSPAEKKSARAKSTPPPDIRISTVTLQGGTVDFRDRYVTPNVHLPMQAIGGRISGLDAIKTNKADVLLRGSLSNNVPLEITGKINPLITKPFVDLKLNLTGIDLSPFTPYSGKYLGHKLEKGQLSVQLNYLVEENKLAGQNKVQLNQLTLGESVPSPDATQLPIKLAIALLKDRKGDIDLDLPVQGDLSDPEFSIGGVVVKMFANLIVNIVTSPFKMLGALFGGGEELAYLEFAPGQTAILPESSGKLGDLSKILYERPNLKLEIQGQVHPEEDVDALRRLRLDQQLKATKLKKRISAGSKAVPLEQIQLTPDERDTQIERAFGKAEFPKPRDEKGRPKKLSTEEKEKLLYTAIEITSDDLRLLAQQRAVAAKEWLLTEGEVEPERLFVIEPQTLLQSDKEEVAPQVKFNLK